MGKLLNSNMKANDWWLIAGLACLWFALMVSPYFPASLSAHFATEPISETSTRHTVYSVFLLSAFAGLIVGRRALVERSGRAPRVVAALCGVLGCLVFTLAPAEGYSSPVVEIVAQAGVAVYLTYFFVAWPTFACRHGARYAMQVIGCSFMVFSVLWAVLMLAGGSFLSWFITITPLITLVCATRYRSSDFVEPSEDSFGSLGALPWGIVALCVVFIYFGVLSVRMLTTMGMGVNTIGTLSVVPHLITALSGLVIVGAFTALFSARGSSTSNIVSVVAAIALVYMAALLVVTLVEPTGTPVLAAKRILVAAEHSTEVLLLVALAVEVARRRLSGVLVFGLCGMVACTGPQLVSLDIMYATGALSHISDTPLVGTVASVGAFFIAAAAIALLINYSRGTVAQAQVQGDQYQTELCRKATAAYAITPRELEVVTYAYRGYSAPKIAEALLVSESTVKAHLAHSYKKLGIHTKQELIALVDSYRGQ